MPGSVPVFHHPLEDRYRRAGGPWDVPDLDELLTRPPEATGAASDRPVLVDGTDRLDASEIEGRVAAAAGGLASIGVRAGDVVAWQTPNWWEAVILYRACWRLGATAAPLHHQAGGAEVTAAVDRLRPRALFGAPDLPAAAMPGAIAVRGVDAGFSPLLEAAEPVRRHAVPPADPADAAVVLLTSGSTGRPKAVVHTHRTLAHKARSMVGIHGVGPADVVLMPAPLAHVSGLLNGVLLPAVAGMTTVLMERWRPASALELIEREHVSFMVGPPAFFVSLMDDSAFRPGAVASLRLLSVGGAGVTPAFVERAAGAFGAEVKRSYGSTEAPTVTTSRPGDPIECRAGTDGRATGDVEIRVVDEAGVPQPPGTAGEIQVRGPELFAGYLSEVPPGSAPRPDPDLAGLDPDGWFATGDLGRLDPDGWLTVVGRAGDVIIRGGENVAAAEVEAVLEAHPLVHQAVAVGYPDDRLGERVGAVVVARGRFDLDTCRAWFAERQIARYKTPERVVAVDELPTLPSGKPDRHAARRLAANTTVAGGPREGTV